LVRQPLKDPRRGRRRLAWRLAAGAVPLRINRSIDGLLGGCRHERLFRSDLHTSWDTPRPGESVDRHDSAGLEQTRGSYRVAPHAVRWKGLVGSLRGAAQLAGCDHKTVAHAAVDTGVRAAGAVRLRR